MNNAPKRKKQSRQDLYVTLIVILMMVSVIVAISVSLAKSSKKIEELAGDDTDKTENVAQTVPEEEDDDIPTIETEDVFLKEEDETKAPDTEENETEKTETTENEEASVIPDFIPPVQGELIKACSLETPVFSLTMEDYRTHSGIDIYCDPGSDIAVVARGTVKEIWDDPMMGMSISVEHPGGAVSVYKNLCDDIPDGIEVGAKLEPGQIIATAGDTALLELCEDSHLHFELYIDEKAVDPCEYIDVK